MNNLVINAGPGTGKTFTLIEAFNFLMTGQFTGFKPTQEQFDIFVKVRALAGKIQPHEIVFIAFNTGIKEFMAERLPAKTKVYTFNGLGQSMIIKKWGFQKLDKYRGQRLLRETIGEQKWDSLNLRERIEYTNLLTFVGHLKEELLPISQDSLFIIAEKYGLTEIPQDLGLIGSIMRKMQQTHDGTIEYRDQVWLGLQAIDRPKFKVAFVDEAQDLSALRLEFALRVAEKCVFCGDPYQSINAFAGADYAAFNKLRDVSESELPLKTCFRCPPNRIRRINEIRPARITAHKTEDGPEERLSLSELPKRILEFAAYHHDVHEDTSNYTVPKDLPIDASDLSKYLLIARTNAQLIKVGLVLSQNKIPCKLVKREEDESIEDILLRFLKSLNALNIADLINKLELQIRQAETLPERASIAQEDKCRSLLEIAKSCSHINEIKKKLQVLTNLGRGAVQLSTIHRAKGLEEPFVFILFPPIRHPRAKSRDAIEQEINLEFVAESRSSYYTAYITN